MTGRAVGLALTEIYSLLSVGDTLGKTPLEVLAIWIFLVGRHQTPLDRLEEFPLSISLLLLTLKRLEDDRKPILHLII